MKILFTGGGSGGHFYPIIAVAQAVTTRAKERKILSPSLYYSAPSKYNPRALFENDIEFMSIPAGKVRRYFSLLNITDIFKTLYGCILALIKIYSLYPDVVFGKGGYASFPTLFAAKLLRIPIIIHESDSKPGRVNLWASKFARKIAISYPDAAEYFKKTPPDRIAHTGNPVRSDIIIPLSNGAHDFLKLEQNTPTILILGGSQGSQNINDVILAALPELLNRYQIIHQTGRANIEEIKSTSDIILKDHPYAHRYHPMDYLNDLTLRMSAGVAEIIVSRAGSTIFEIAAWGIPSIIIPLPHSISHDQTSNAFSYGRTGAATVVQENNLSAHIIIGEIDRIHNNPTIQQTMKDQAKAFARLDSSTLIADVLIDIALEHER
ncbi:MAG: UDP-N-acetylglucosamine--N-acetylmuramyl-(pentapeptide) pyrophosphoryl-undecaprenol N-acetylglucosam [Parcubacteria bacterium C7867-002]|nr:MAG: UDP-N-acetylglucosamine--N-acetylmuramyl-(pentapeptide) pyrophosphoryl-undecaprenol N-acetylglucosam [Parcubacteria bacterium C7867-002]